MTSVTETKGSSSVVLVNTTGASHATDFVAADTHNSIRAKLCYWFHIHISQHTIVYIYTPIVGISHIYIKTRSAVAF